MVKNVNEKNGIKMDKIRTKINKTELKWSKKLKEKWIYVRAYMYEHAMYEHVCIVYLCISIYALCVCMYVHISMYMYVCIRIYVFIYYIVS